MGRVIPKRIYNGNISHINSGDLSDTPTMLKVTGKELSEVRIEILRFGEHNRLRRFEVSYFVDGSLVEKVKDLKDIRDVRKVVGALRAGFRGNYRYSSSHRKEFYKYSELNGARQRHVASIYMKDNLVSYTEAVNNLLAIDDDIKYNVNGVVI